MLDPDAPAASFTQEARLSQHCLTGANFWFKQCVEETLEGEIRELFTKAWQLEIVQAQVGNHYIHPTMNVIRDGRVLRCNDYAIIKEFWVTRADYELPWDDVCADTDYASQLESGERTLSHTKEKNKVHYDEYGRDYLMFDNVLLHICTSELS
jgi:hypothetical protein